MSRIAALNIIGNHGKNRFPICLSIRNGFGYRSNNRQTSIWCKKGYESQTNYFTTSCNRTFGLGIQYGKVNESIKRCFTTFAGSSLKSGMIFLHDDKYCEVTSNRQVKQGRGSASLQVEYVELPSRKPMTINLPIGAKVDKIDLEKQGALVQYFDEDARELVVSDESFEEKRISASTIGDGVKLLEAGDELQLFYHDDTIVKVSLPNTITSRLKKK
ncbi:Elongation factor P (EF-P) KOW-like domain family protein [Babesia bovis T2Bo]|uniref:Elongation factor P (EF-P) KOW-like domain family protein n=1 Tax=Babesia bovis T2Bo TaxID=484906 RepID=UPI001DF7E2BE|nr:Elongation factor P (EF-P) KOW-like domain family protein [Babesia bovis T2Bo]EDO05887.2 Elongation factor P (EF-P) KOW-like domain family protein [Babesia bovis T2Bo]